MVFYPKYKDPVWILEGLGFTHTGPGFGWEMPREKFRQILKKPKGKFQRLHAQIHSNPTLIRLHADKVFQGKHKAIGDHYLVRQFIHKFNKMDMDFNEDAALEILHRDGGEAALNYLIGHEHFTREFALDWVGVHTNPEKIPNALGGSYYCQRDALLFHGESSVCPECGGDVMKNECLIPIPKESIGVNTLNKTEKIRWFQNVIQWFQKK